MMRLCAVGRSFAVVLVLPFVLGLQPLQITLDGRVLSRVNERPVSGAAVRLQSLGLGAVTDEEGRFSFEGVEIEEGDTLLVQHSDFRLVRIPLGIPDAAARWSLEIRLVPGPIGSNGEILGAPSATGPGR